ncbi:unnamed protein product [Phytophthora fragariaefolia]|uniref:Unnamed protein product n=1 Tax=Phytophthora fragariaefolia TaxID=1490495 RepID=A0A9W6YQ10_9STRA|nr:unnamed protein product [Phytophthora fragariaefolia]
MVASVADYTKAQGPHTTNVDTTTRRTKGTATRRSERSRERGHQSLYGTVAKWDENGANATKPKASRTTSTEITTRTSGAGASSPVLAQEVGLVLRDERVPVHQHTELNTTVTLTELAATKEAVSSTAEKRPNPRKMSSTAKAPMAAARKESATTTTNPVIPNGADQDDNEGRMSATEYTLQLSDDEVVTTQNGSTFVKRLLADGRYGDMQVADRYGLVTIETVND